MAPEASIVPDVSPNRETACSVRSSSAGQALICGSRRPVVSAIRGCASCSRAGPTRSRWWHSPPRPRVSSGPCWSKEKFTATAPARRLLPDGGRQPPRSRSCLSEGQLWCDGKWSGNRDRNTPYRHRASQRAAMIGIRSAFSIRARGQRPLLEAVYMTAPRFTCRNTKNALAERGPSIHDGFHFAVPAKAGTHNPRRSWMRRDRATGSLTSSEASAARRMGPCLRGDDVEKVHAPLLLRCLRRRNAMTILRGRVRGFEPGAALAEQFFAQGAFLVGLFVAAAADQFRDQQLDDVLEIAGRNRKGDVQAVDIGLIDPGFDLVGDLFGRADHHRPDAADADMLG